jgi:hypothetical protein
LGHDTFYDAGWGDPMTAVLTNDWACIHDFHGLHRSRIVETVREMAEREAAELRARLESALQRFDRVMLAVHVPPFVEACVCGVGKMRPATHRPWYVNRTMGTMLERVADAHEDKRIHVFAGHVHGIVDLDILPNLRCSTAGAEYGSPAIHRIVTPTVGEPLTNG